MATPLAHYESSHVGNKAGISSFHVDPSNGDPLAYHPANAFSKNFQKLVLAEIVQGAYPNTTTGQLWTVSVPNTGDSFAPATTQGGGVLATCGSDGTFSTNAASVLTWTPVVNKWVCAAAILQTSDITTVGFEFGIGSTQIDPATTDYTDCVGFKMAVGAGTIIGKVRGNSGTVANSSTLYTATAATDLFCALAFNLGVPVLEGSTVLGTGASSTTQTLAVATAPQRAALSQIALGDIIYFATSALYRRITAINYTTGVLTVDATLSSTTAEAITVFRPGGGFWIGADVDSTTFTAFTDAQLTQLAKILTTPPSFYLNLNAKGSASTPTVLWKTVMNAIDR